MLKNGLGKGLGSLIMDTDLNHSNPTVVELKIVDVEPNKNQPRHSFDEEKLHDLAASIKEHGVITPILVKKQENGFYKIIAGERRWRASKIAGKKTIPAIIKDFTHQQIQEVALIENLQREDLNPIEEAKGYKMLMDEFDLTQEMISQKVSKSRSSIANSLRLLNLTTKVCRLLEQDKISVGHAKVLLSVDNEDLQESYAQTVIDENLSVRELERLIKENPEGKKKVKKEKKEDLNLKLAFMDFEKIAKSALGTKVTVKGSKKKGKIEIEYYGNEDLERIAKLLNIRWKTYLQIELYWVFTI